MLASSNIITFNDGLGSTINLPATSIEMGVLPVGKIKEMIDFSEKEDLRGGKQTFEIVLKLDNSEAIWMSNFLLSTDKQITVDGSTFFVVQNGINDVKFALWQRSAAAVEIKLRLRTKGVALTASSSYTGHDDMGVLT